MAVEAPGIAGSRCAADFEQQGACFQHLRQDDLLRLEGMDLGVGVKLLGYLPLLAGFVHCLQALAHGGDLRIGGEGQARQATDHRLHSRVCSRLRLPRHTEGTGAALDERYRIGQYRLADTRQGGQMHRLVERGEVRLGTQFALGETAQQMLRLHPDPGETGGATASQPLAEAVPVVDPLHARRTGRYHEADKVVAMVGHCRHPIGVQRAGAVVLFAVQAVTTFVFAQLHGIAGAVGALGHGRAPQFTGNHAGEPVVLGGSIA